MSSWWQEGHPTTKILHLLPLMECTSFSFPPLLFLHLRTFSSLRMTWWNGVNWIYGEGEQTQVHLQGWLLNRCVCVSYQLANIT